MNILRPQKGQVSGVVRTARADQDQHRFSKRHGRVLGLQERAVAGSKRSYVNSFKDVRPLGERRQRGPFLGEALHNWLGGTRRLSVWNNRVYVQYSRPAQGQRAAKPANKWLNMPQLTFLMTR